MEYLLVLLDVDGFFCVNLKNNKIVRCVNVKVYFEGMVNDGNFDIWW